MKRFLHFSQEEVAHIMKAHIRREYKLDAIGYVCHVEPKVRRLDMPEDALGELKIEVKSLKEEA